jgi:mutator protein MutT
MSKERHKLIPAVFIIFKHKGKILLSRRFNTGHADGMYSFPSGHVEPTESFVVAAIREAKEEVGVQVKAKDLKFIYCQHDYFNSPNPNEMPYINIFLLCEKWKGEMENVEPEKCDDLKWVDPKKLPKNTIHYIKEVVKGILNKKHFSELAD